MKLTFAALFASFACSQASLDVGGTDFKVTLEFMEGSKCYYTASWDNTLKLQDTKTSALACYFAPNKAALQLGGAFVADVVEGGVLLPKNGCTLVPDSITYFQSQDKSCYPDTVNNNFVFETTSSITKSCVLVCDCGIDTSGDPHVKPWNSPRYYFMGECDTVFHTSELMDIHIRTAIKDAYSVITAAAIKVGDSILEVAMGNTHTFWINGQEFTDDDLPLKMEGKYTLQLGEQVHQGSGTNYELKVDLVTVQLRAMRSLMGVDMNGYSSAFAKGTGGLSGQYPHGELLGRDGVTLFEIDGVAKTLTGKEEPVCNSIGQEWQVRDTDPQLFRTVQEPAYPNQCKFPTAETSTEAIRRRLNSVVDMETASKVCAQVHEEGSEDFDFCVMDVLMMDDIGVAYSW